MLLLCFINQKFLKNFIYKNTIFNEENFVFDKTSSPRRISREIGNSGILKLFEISTSIIILYINQIC